MLEPAVISAESTSLFLNPFRGRLGGRGHPLSRCLPRQTSAHANIPDHGERSNVYLYLRFGRTGVRASPPTMAHLFRVPGALGKGGPHRAGGKTVWDIVRGSRGTSKIPRIPPQDADLLERFGKLWFVFPRKSLKKFGSTCGKRRERRRYECLGPGSFEQRGGDGNGFCDHGTVH